MVMCKKLNAWFVQFKCTASEGSLSALGRLDPITKETLFTSDTKSAVENCRLKAEYLQDPLPMSNMYETIPPNPNSPHGLNEYLLRRG